MRKEIEMDAEEILEKILREGRSVNIAFHHDADGVASACLISSVFKVDLVTSPERFGDYSFVVFKGEKKPVDISLDLGSPIDNFFQGIAIDHHTHEEPYYPLIWRTYPTSLIVYELFRDRIPEREKWKVCIGLVGDGEPERIPDEIWDSYPELLEEKCFYWSGRGTEKLYPTPIYVLLSSPVNATCRVGSPVEALRFLRECSSPRDVLNHPVMNEHKETVRKEESRVLQEAEIYYLRSYFAVVMYRSRVRLEGRIASRLKNSNPNTTFLVINLERRDLSLRGTLAGYIGRKLCSLGLEVGGHPGAFGGRIESESEEEILRMLRKVI